MRIFCALCNQEITEDDNFETVDDVPVHVDCERDLEDAETEEL